MAKHHHSCNYPECKNNSRQRCEYCNKSFCKEHLEARLPGMPHFDESSHYDRMLMLEWRKPGGHACPIYYDYVEKQREIESKKYGLGLDALLHSQKDLGKYTHKKKIEIDWEPKHENKEKPQYHKDDVKPKKSQEELKKYESKTEPEVRTQYNDNKRKIFKYEYTNVYPMGLFRFTLGTLGVLLIIGAFSSFIPLFFLGGIATGNVAFAIGLPIFLMIFGAAMAYYGFYKGETREKSNGHLIDIAKLGVVYTIAIILGNYVISKLMIANTLLAILLIATMVSFIAQIIRSHETPFKWKWFIFYFLVFAIIIWAIGEFIIPNVSFQTGLFSSIVTGFTIAGAVIIVQKLNMKHHSVQWTSVVLAIVLLVANLDSLQISTLKPLVGLSPNDSSGLPEGKQVCPTLIAYTLLVKPYGTFETKAVGTMLVGAINTSVWRIEENIRSCYSGRYKGQRPDWVYCDDMIVSRWETSGSGTISYRWYTAVTFEWQPVREPYSDYVLRGISCENGQKVTVNKETTAYYVHVSRDGTEIKIQY